MELTNITANFLGDSITEGCGTTDWGAKPFHQLIAKRYGMKLARNYGIGGTRFARQQDPREPIDYQDMAARFATMEDDANLVVLFGGTNDFCHGDAPFGTFEDRTQDTFCGACHYIMEGLIKKYLHARIVVMTPLHREDEDVLYPNNGRPLCDYVEMIRKVAGYYSLPVIDLWAGSGIQPRVPQIKEAFCPDGLHPNDAGHEKMAAYIASCLQGL